MNKAALKATIIAHAALIDQLKRNVDKFYLEKNKSEEKRQKWSEACSELHEKLDSLTFPPYGVEEGVKLIQQGDADALEAAIAFLEVDPFFFRAGYAKEKFLESIKKSMLTETQMEELRAVVLMVVEKTYRPEFRSYCKLAKALYTPELRLALNILVRSRDYHVAKRAQWMLDTFSR